MMSLSETRNVMATVGHASCGVVLDKFFQKADARVMLIVMDVRESSAYLLKGVG